MPSRRAAARASSRSSGAQQERPRARSEKSWTRMETPTTSCPSATSSAAAADESTPPERATSTRTALAPGPDRDLQDELRPGEDPPDALGLGSRGALHADGPPVRLHDAAGHRQADAAAGVARALRLPGGVEEGLEDVLLVLRRDAGPLVGDGEAQRAPLPLDLDQHLAPVRRELHGVAHQVH